jgi:cell division inhibitor SepF
VIVSMFRRAMDYLGLGPDDAYDDYDASVAVERPRRTRPVASRSARPEPRFEEYDDGYEEQDEYFDEPVVQRRAPIQRDDSSVHVRPTSRQNATVKTIATTSAEPTPIRPVRYDEAKDIADMVKAGRPVLMDIGAAEETVARRLIDFVSGLIYGVDGSMEKVAPGVFLIKPRGVRVVRG